MKVFIEFIEFKNKMEKRFKSNKSYREWLNYDIFKER